MHRLLGITLFFAKQNLALPGHKRNESSLHEINFLQIVEMLSKYDSVLQKHLKNRSTCELILTIRDYQSLFLLLKTQNDELLVVIVGVAWQII